MLDRRAGAFIRPGVDHLAGLLVRVGVGANALSFAGLGLGGLAAVCIASGAFWPGAVLILVSRLFDGLDGAVARLTAPTDRGGFLDISLDFLFYAAIPLAFAIANPAAHALASAVLLAAFLGTGTSFLAFAVLAAKRGMASVAYPEKSFYFLGGLTEASETLIVFLAMCLWPRHYALLAYAFAALCTVTIATRLHMGWVAFAPRVDLARGVPEYMIKSTIDMLAAADAVVPRISPAAARDLMAAGDAVVVDVREAHEVQDSGKIPGALLVPRGLLEFRADPQSPQFDPLFRAGAAVILYCAVGGRSALAGQTLKQMGYAQVYNLGGFADWVADGGAVERAGPSAGW